MVERAHHPSPPGPHPTPPRPAGKSNLLDAICFVCGVTARQLRGEKLRDLVWRVVGRDGAVAGAQGATASVTLVYVTDDGEMDGVPGGTEVRFSRSITVAGTSVYRLDAGPEVSWDVYRGRLEEINVVTRAKNFLVFQVSSGVGRRGWGCGTGLWMSPAAGGWGTCLVDNDARPYPFLHPVPFPFLGRSSSRRRAGRRGAAGEQGRQGSACAL